jgi:hypothetical protein
MTSSGAIIDLSDDTVGMHQVNKKRKAEGPRLEHVWIAYHQLEGTHDINFEYNYSHAPTTFDKKILGVFISQKAARRCAYEACIDNDMIEEDEDEEDEEQDEDERNAGYNFERKGVFREGGDRMSFNERIHIKKQEIQQE